jgi:hypothetical protein
MRLALIRRPLVSLLVLSSGLTVTELASAQAVSDKSSTASASLVWSTRDNFYGAGAELGDSDVNVKVGFSFNAEADVKKDLLRVDMSKGALIEASWGDGKTMTLKSSGSNNKEGFLRAEYQLAPTVDLFVDATNIPLVGQTYSFTWNANQLLNQVHGANFEYHAANQANFEPWGWQGAKFTIPGAPIATSKLVSVTFDEIVGSDSPLKGDIAINMTTTPTFTYKTTSITLDKNAPLVKEGEEVEMSAVDTDFLDVDALVKGEIDYEGTMNVHPTIGVNEIDLGQLSIPVDITFDITGAGKEFDYSSKTDPGETIPVNFPSTTFHIPLPNVKVRDRSIDMGTSTIGEELKKSVLIENTGEMGAVLDFESSDPQFKIGKATKIAAKNKYDLEVLFVPENAGPASATITVKSNDPNEPKVEIKVTANGAKLEDPPAKADPEPLAVAQPGSDSGCGCVAAGSSHAPSSSLALGGFALGLAAFASRRRSRR